MAGDLRRLENAVKQAQKDHPPYLKYAFHNVYNYSVLGGFAATALLTQDWRFGVLGAALETLWMIFAPDSKLLRRFWFDRVHGDKVRAQAAAERARLLASLPAQDGERIVRVEQQRDQILKLCGENAELTADLLQGELTKLDQISQSFVDLVISSRRYEDYMATVDLDQLERDIRQYTTLSERARDESQKKIAQKNLAVLAMRKDKLAEIHLFIRKARGQMDLIENTLQLLTDQIVTMRSPKELGGQLDELIDGVEAVRTTARETEALMASMTH